VGRVGFKGVIVRPLGFLSRWLGWARKPASRAAAPPLTTDQMLQQEAEAIHHANLAGETGSDLHKSLNGLGSNALCLSGGGIRSAAFGLGVIQALAAHPRSTKGLVADNADNCLLAWFHYLSTVSGGGYIGSWLSAWRARESFSTIWPNLVGRPDGSDAEPPTIAWLRSYSNYLTPKLGLTSADAWAVLALYLRNLVLNWLVIVPALCVGILALKLVIVALVGLAHHSYALNVAWLAGAPLAVEVFGVLGVLCLIIALRFITRRLPPRSPELAGPASAGLEDSDQTFLCGSLVWSLCSAVALTLCLDMLVFLDKMNPKAGFLMCAACGPVIYVASWFGRPSKREFSDFFAWSASGLVYGLLVGSGFFWFFYYYLGLYSRGSIAEAAFPLIVSKAVAPLVVGVPWILLSQFAAHTTFVGLTSYRPKFNTDQEWFGRASGWLLLTAAVSGTAMFVIFAGSLAAIRPAPVGIPVVYHFLKDWAVPAVALVGLVVAVAGASSFSRFDGLTGISAILTDGISAIAALLFICGLIFSLSTILDRLLSVSTLRAMLNGDPQTSTDYVVWKGTVISLSVGLMISLFFAIITSPLININRFSLHEIYRNRLTRAFLGASRIRKPDLFTGFDEGDDVQMHALVPPEVAGDKSSRFGAGGWRPFHVVNLTLNIVSEKRLAWQERKAASFTVSPLHCGTSSKSTQSAKDLGNLRDRAEGAYRLSSEYGGPDGLSLGTAMAISGAASNPNMGYYSSPAVRFLMTMFNLRLGWWLGNSGPEGAKSYGHEGPVVAILPLLQETLGLTTDNRAYVNLSDGGHFDNLGLYEMVRRRCRFILIADAGRDPDYAFADLGNAVRKISIDLGVPIHFFGNLEGLKRRPLDGSDLGPDCNYHALAEIDYQTADSSRDIKNGAILYVKAGYHGTESAAVRSYALANPEFPHQSTMNQWFSESQFESYRLLGFEIMDGLLNRILANASFADDPSLENLMAALKSMATPALRHALALQQREPLSRSNEPPAVGI
jgi:hypothetical protein